MVGVAVQKPKANKERDAWVATVERLVRQVESWATKRSWPVHRDVKEIRESRIGTYQVPTLSILSPSGTIQVDPVARYVGRTDGRVDLLAWPSMNRILLILQDDIWKIKTDSGVSWPQKWGPKAFAYLAHSLHANS